jgi:hypothetical protein
MYRKLKTYFEQNLDIVNVNAAYAYKNMAWI